MIYMYVLIKNQTNFYASGARTPGAPIATPRQDELFEKLFVWLNFVWLFVCVAIVVRAPHVWHPALAGVVLIIV
jgi:hypothetical protein